MTVELVAVIARRVGRPAEIVWGRSRSAPVRAEFGPAGVTVRLHRIFETAPAEIGEALAAWLAVGRRARRHCATLDHWIDARLAELPRRPRRRITLETRGRCHDLAPLARELLASEFPELPPPAVTWGRRGRSRARRSLHLGSYDPGTRVVRIHPVLDDESVPAWFVRAVLFHELLHAAVDPTGHGAAFRTRERRFPDHDRAGAWQRENIARLIHRARTSTSAPARRLGCG